MAREHLTNDIYQEILTRAGKNKQANKQTNNQQQQQQQQKQAETYSSS